MSERVAFGVVNQLRATQKRETKPNYYMKMSLYAHNWKTWEEKERERETKRKEKKREVHKTTFECNLATAKLPASKQAHNLPTAAKNAIKNYDNHYIAFNNLNKKQKTDAVCYFCTQLKDTQDVSNTRKSEKSNKHSGGKIRFAKNINVMLVFIHEREEQGDKIRSTMQM